MWTDYVDILIVIFALLLAILFVRDRYEYWEIRGVPYAKPFFIFGSIKSIILRKLAFAEYYRQQYEHFSKHPVVGIFRGLSPSLVIREPNLIKDILVRDFDHFEGRGLLHNSDVDFLADNLLFMTGDRWRLVRKYLTPVFTSTKLKSMYPLIHTAGNLFQNYIKEINDKQTEYELKELAEDYTITVIGYTGFGIETNTLQNDNTVFRSMGKKIFEPSAKNAIRFILADFSPRLYKLVRFKIFAEYEQFFLDLVKNVMDDRVQTNSRKNDFIDMCLDLKKEGVLQSSGNQEVEVTDKLLTAQAFFFFIAGYETSAGTLSYALYELAVNPEVQEKLIEEVDKLMEKYENMICHECIQEANYLEMVLDETLRKYPPVGFLERICNKTYELKHDGRSLIIDEGVKVTIPIYGIHYDPMYYPDPENFNPERFSKDNINNRPAFTYLPFGEGPRICFGLRFAKIQVKVGIMSVLQKFRIEKTERTPAKIALTPGTFITKAKGGLWVKFTPRNSS